MFGGLNLIVTRETFSHYSLAEIYIHPCLMIISPKVGSEMGGQIRVISHPSMPNNLPNKQPISAKSAFLHLFNNALY